MSMGMTELAVEEIVSDTDGTNVPPNRCIIDELDTSHDHYQRILADFQAAEIKILKIEKLQNPSLTDLYVSARQNLLKFRGGNLNPDYKLNEKYLYHGTASPKGHICEQGLDDKLAGEGCFGKGIYFSDNIKKCIRYANRCQGDEGMILCVRAILGEAKVYEDGKTEPSLKREPEKKGAVKGFRYYCSVQGRPREYNEFVVYRKNQALIEYLITYSKTSSTGPVVPKPIPKPVSVSPKPAVDSVSSSDEEREKEPEDNPEKGEYSSDTNSSHSTESDHNSESYNYKSSDEDPEREIDPAKKREMFIEQTGEKTDSIIDSFLLATAYHLDIAVDLYLNRDKIEEELEKIRTSLEEEGYQTTDEDGKEITFHPEGIPHYDSEEWKKHSKDEQDDFIEKFLSIFMDAIALEREHSEFARGFLQNNNYNIDQTIIAFYSSI